MGNENLEEDKGKNHLSNEPWDSGVPLCLEAVLHWTYKRADDRPSLGGVGTNSLLATTVHPM